MKSLLVAAFAAFAASAASTQIASAQVDPNRVVAIVNGEEIKGAEYYHRMEFLPGVGKPSGKTFSEFPPGFLTIEQLITERLVLQLAKKKGVMPTDLELEDEYQKRKADTPNIDEIWAASGRSPEDLRHQIEYELAQFKIQTFGITITNQEIEDFYANHPDDFTVPKKYQLRVIVVKSDADKQAVDTALAASKPFAEVARQYSADVTKANGGEYGSIPETMLATPIKTALTDVKIGSTTDWISSQSQPNEQAFVKFLIENIDAPKKLPLDTKLRRRIREKLMLERGSVKNNIAKEMRDIRSEAKIDIKQPEFRDAYEKYIKAYLQEGG